LVFAQFRRCCGASSPWQRAEGIAVLNRSIAIGFAVAGTVSYFWPGFNGMLFEPSNISVGESRIIAAIFLVGAAIVWFIREPPKE